MRCTRTYLSVKEGSTRTHEAVSLTRQSSRGDVLRQTAEVTIIDVEPAFPTL